MAGEESLSGLIYQQRYTNYRVLSQLALATAGVGGGPPALARFVVEGRGGVAGPIWDIVFEFPDGVLDLHECKDTAIAKDDRLTLYDRLRREIAAGTAAEKINPVWVTDPEKQTPNALSYLDGIPGAVEKLDLSKLPATLPKRVDSTEKAIQEAVWRLCHYSGVEPTDPDSEKDDKKEDKKPAAKIDWPRPCTFEEAKTLLQNLRVARHRFADLDQSIKLLSTGVFATGTPASVQIFVTGVLTERVISAGRAEFTVAEFLQAIGTVTVEHGVSGTMRELMTFAAASGLTSSVRRIVWRNLPQNPETRWSLNERAPMYEPGRSGCLIADMGIGKTVASQLAFEQEATHGHPSRTLRIEARTLDAARVDALLRLSCMLCGVGPTWVAIDGLDEIPHSLGQQWIRVLSTLTSLPNLTVLVTARREVLAVHEWLDDAVSPLHRVEMQLLSATQVEEAFSKVGLPPPKNPQLVAVLRNPFLLSLYADIVATTDMPLAESGEVTAFRVIEEFWKRRVRGISEGQRAVGSSETSQEAKRRAAVFLGDQTLAGNLILSRDGADSEAARGIEMLLLEGVIREQGSTAVAWGHDWLREYSLIQTLIARITSPTAVSLARIITTDCTEDHVARSAAAAGLKWIMGNPAAGTATDYLTELGKISPGLAREALIVLLEGSASAGALNQLPDEVLADALTLAVSLRVPQWGNEVAAIDEARFLGPVGNRLHGIAVDYELTVAGGSADVATVRRLVQRDLLRWKAKLPCSMRTFRMLLEAIVGSRAFGVPEVDEWLIVVSSVSNQYSFGRMLDAIAGLLCHGATELACKVFRATLGMEDAESRQIVAEALVNRKLSYERDVLKILGTPGLLLNLETWGSTAIELLAALIEAKQRHSWPSSLRFARALGEEIEEAFAPDYDEDPRITALDSHDDDNPIVRIRMVLEQAFAELAVLPDGKSLRDLTDRALATRFAAAIVIPMLSLLDAGKDAGKQRDWHEGARVQLLSDAAVMAFESLHDVRRLLRRQLPVDLDAESKDRVVNCIRQSAISPDYRIRELSDLRNWSVLTADELEGMDVAQREEVLREPVDPRTEPLFTIGRGVIPTQPRRDSGWPYAEDEEQIRLLSERMKVSRLAAPPSPLDDEFAQRLDAVKTVLARPEAKTEPWLGSMLGWCAELVGSLQDYAQSVAKQANEPLQPLAWEELLNEHAPWWRDMVDAALDALVGPVPKSHANSILERRLSWSSNDIILRSSDFLETVLAIGSVSAFAEIQARLVAAITERWNDWPPFTKATVLSSLRTWYFAMFPELRMLLTEMAKTETDAVVVRYAVDHLVVIAQSQSAPEIGDLLERAKTGGHDESLDQIARLLGATRIFQTQDGAGASDDELIRLLDVFMNGDWPDRAALMHFLHGLLFGAREALGHISEKNDQVYDGWLLLAEQVVERWPFDTEVSGGIERFPLHAICSVIEAEPTVEMKTSLFLKLTPMFETILRLGNLSAFCQLHFDLKDFIAGARSPIHGQEKELLGVLVTDETEQAFVKLCRCSMERVVRWRQEGVQTDDLGWASGLRGEDTVELIERCMAAAGDRERFKREFLPFVDLLVAAGQPEQAAQLRVFLRRL